MNSSTSFINYFGHVIEDLFRMKSNKNISGMVLLRQIYFTGYEAFFVIAILSLLLGGIIIHEGHEVFGKLGAKDWVYKILVSTIVRDFGPIITSFIVLARSGTAISTELGNMSYHKEIDSIKSLGINPISYIVTPRIVGMIVSMIILILYFSIIGVVGGYIVKTIISPMKFMTFFDHFIRALRFSDIFFMIAKTAFCGLFISSICSYQGLQVRKAITEVPQRNIKAVVHSVFAIFLVNGIGVALYIILEVL